jgi:curved DNA-binding protein CbpA
VTDHYEVLQVARTAEPVVIRAAFRALARKYHPDSGGSANVMKAINEAWAVLGDAARRAAYDAAGPSDAGQGNRRKADRRRTSDRRSAAPPTDRSPGRGMGRRYGAAEGGLDFGRYAGWLRRTPIGRPFSAQIEEVLASRSNVKTAPPPGRRGWRTHR